MRQGLVVRSSKYILHNTSRKKASSCPLGGSTPHHHHHHARPSINFPTLHSRKIHIQPLPVPAVAICDACEIYDEIGGYDYYISSDGGDCHVHRASQDVDILLATAAGGSAGSGNGSGGSSLTGSGGIGDGSSNRFVRNGGGKGGGPHRCPKCGSNVTFHDASASVPGNNGNTYSDSFYCAACSGWFLTQPNCSDDASSTTAHSKYLMSKLALGGGGEGGGDDIKAAGFPTTPSNRKHSQPQFVMQHVS